MKCDCDKIVNRVASNTTTDNVNDYAIQFQLEGGGVYCIDG